MAEARSGARTLLETHPRLRDHMRGSERFAKIAARERLVIDDETHYLVRGDALGGLEDLYVETLVRGAGTPSRDPEAEAVFAELDEDLKAVIRERIRPRP